MFFMLGKVFGGRFVDFGYDWIVVGGSFIIRSPLLIQAVNGLYPGE